MKHIDTTISSNNLTDVLSSPKKLNNFYSLNASRVINNVTISDSDDNSDDNSEVDDEEDIFQPINTDDNDYDFFQPGKIK